MQTFLTDPSIAVTAASLDRQRLGKQRVECMQILNALCDIFYNNDTGRIEEREAKGYQNHAASRMWRGYERALVEYGMIVTHEWIKRGYNDTCAMKFLAYDVYLQGLGFAVVWPDWWINEPMQAAVIRSHRSNLIRKDPAHYRDRWPDVPDDLDYVWPVD